MNVIDAVIGMLTTDRDRNPSQTALQYILHEHLGGEKPILNSISIIWMKLLKRFKTNDGHHGWLANTQNKIYT